MFVKIITVIILGLFLLYLILPTPPFPQGLPNSWQSTETGDSKDLVHQRAYFTDFKREEVISFYEKQFNHIQFLGLQIPAPTYRLNHPPEDGKQIIHDQIRTYYLEEIVHPFRESFYINGFIPQSEKDAIIIEARQFYQKVNVKYVYSMVVFRVLLAIASFVLLVLTIKSWWKISKND